MGDPKTGKPESQGPEFVDEPFNEPGDQDTTPPDETKPEDQSGG